VKYKDRYVLGEGWPSTSSRWTAPLFDQEYKQLEVVIPAEIVTPGGPRYRLVLERVEEPK
jgi:hypothetical protein